MTKAQDRQRRNFKIAFAKVTAQGFKPFTKPFGAAMKKELAKLKKK